MNFYIASTLCWNYSPKEVIQLAKQYGLSGVEMWAEHLYAHRSDPLAVREYASETGIGLTLHASSWDLNICSLNQGIRQQSVVELKKSIDLANQLEVRHVTFHPGRYTVKSYLASQHFQGLVESVQELLVYAKEKDVVLSMELMEEIPKEFVTRPEQMNACLKEVGEDLRTTLDIAHVPLTENPIDYFQTMHQINSIHLSDTSQETFHVPLGEGDIALGAVLDFLQDKDMPIVLEGMDTTRQLDFLKKHLVFLQQNGWMEGKELD